MYVRYDTIERPNESQGNILQVPNHSKSFVVYLMTGLNKADKKEMLGLTAKDVNAPLSKVVQECRWDQAQILLTAIANHFYWKAMQIP